jgi:hypothetical protein
MMDKKKLRQCAAHLDVVLKIHKGESEDVDFLINLPILNDAIRDAKSEIIDVPRDLGLGLGIWMQESNIRDYGDISNSLAQLTLLLKGWELLGKPSWES